jgi:hypothetical protein
MNAVFDGPHHFSSRHLITLRSIILDTMREVYTYKGVTVTGATPREKSDPATRHSDGVDGIVRPADSVACVAEAAVVDGLHPGLRA